MLDAFESRLADLLAGALPAGAGIGVVRPGVALPPAVPPDEPPRVTAVVRLRDAAPAAHLGDDSRERLGEPGAYRLRPILQLAGEAAVELTVSAGEAERRTLFAALDRVLLALHPQRVRGGSGFATDTDLGFALDGFRLARVAPDPESPESFRRLHAVYAYSGRFWPVEEPAEGDIITGVPTRIEVTPA